MPDTDARTAKIKEIERVERAIDESIAWISAKEEEMQNFVSFIESLPKDAWECMSGSASRSRTRRGMGKAATKDEERSMYNTRLVEMREAIRAQWLKLEDLKEQKRELQR
ncbi:hypothetical protein CDD83_6526 [Cordyceps sp. RAO-2017]|nr:hypothetical protein CDD83_6526 [Cordyceps sp. RAO-2017]